MYKRHKRNVICLSVILLISCYFLRLDYKEIAEVGITVVSIELAVYIAAASVLLGSPYAHNLKHSVDPEIKTKTQLGVLTSYLRAAGILSVLTIVISSVFILLSDVIGFSLTDATTLTENLYYVASAISLCLFGLNILFLWLIFQFLVNSLGKASSSKLAFECLNNTSSKGEKAHE